MSSARLHKLIRILADGEFHSGEEIGKALGLSRTAVWKQLKGLENLGLSVLSRKGLGYKFDTPLDLLDRNIVLSELGGSSECFIHSLDLTFEQASTNQTLIDRAAQGLNIHRHLVVTECQTQGRGRRGRSWYSPFAQNLYFSLGWRTSNGVAAVEGLSLVVGLAVCRALSEFGVKDLALKWPNDILLSGRKLGGVLVELSGDISGDCDIVIGVGLNVLMSSLIDDAGLCEKKTVIDFDSKPPGFTKIPTPWVSLIEQVEKPERNRVLIFIVRHILSILEGFEESTFSCYRKEWESLHFFQNKAVELISSQNKIVGVVIGVDDSGALVLNVDGVIHTFHGGELSLRAAS